MGLGIPGEDNRESARRIMDHTSFLMRTGVKGAGANLRTQFPECDREVLQLFGNTWNSITDAVAKKNLKKTTDAITTDWLFALPTIELCRGAEWREPLKNVLKRKNLQPILEKALSEALQSMDHRVEPGKLSRVRQIGRTLVRNDNGQRLPNKPGPKLAR